MISHSRSPCAERDIVGDEAVAGDAQRFLDHRVAGEVEFEARLIDQRGQAPLAFGRALGIARGDVEPGDGVGGGGDARRGGDGQGGQFLGVGGLGGERVRAGLDHAARLAVEVGRIEAHHPGQGLAVGEAAVGGHQPVGVARGDFDMIAEHGVVADLERGDAGRLAVARFKRGDGAAAVAADVAQRVERGVIAFGDIAALGRVERRGVRPARR